VLSAQLTGWCLRITEADSFAVWLTLGNTVHGEPKTIFGPKQNEVLVRLGDLSGPSPPPRKYRAQVTSVAAQEVHEAKG
jgi:hypothetical protein